MSDISIQLSVLMPVYNGETYLEKAISSVLNQTFKDFEFIIINDGSTDSTHKIISSFSDKRIVYINNEQNNGLVKSLNTGLKRAAGKYIARMDADDVSSPDRFKKQLEIMKNDPSLITIGSSYYSVKNSAGRYISAPTGSEYLKSILLFSTCFCHPSVMMRNVYMEYGVLYDEKYRHAEDYQLWTTLSSKGKFDNIDQPLLKYRTHGAQISNAFTTEQLLISSGIRENYLTALGFTYTALQLKTHNLIGDNVFIKSSGLLTQVEDWLNNLIAQNEKIKALSIEQFNKAMHKFWLDSCGNTNLGLKSFRIYKNSRLSRIVKVRRSDEFRLFVKCIVRGFKR